MTTHAQTIAERTQAWTSESASSEVRAVLAALEAMD